MTRYTAVHTLRRRTCEKEQGRSVLDGSHGGTDTGVELGASAVRPLGLTGTRPGLGTVQGRRAERAGRPAVASGSHPWEAAPGAGSIRNPQELAWPLPRPQACSSCSRRECGLHGWAGRRLEGQGFGQQGYGTSRGRLAFSTRLLWPEWGQPGLEEGRCHAQSRNTGCQVLSRPLPSTEAITPQTHLPAERLLPPPFCSWPRVHQKAAPMRRA